MGEKKKKETKPLCAAARARDSPASESLKL